MKLTPAAAADKLGRVYEALRDEKLLPADAWIVPGRGSQKTRLYLALQMAFDRPDAQPSWLDEWYEEAYQEVVPIVEFRAQIWFHDSLGALSEQLRCIQNDLADRDRDIARQVQEAAKEVVERANSLEVELTDSDRQLTDEINGAVAAQNHYLTHSEDEGTGEIHGAAEEQGDRPATPQCAPVAVPSYPPAAWPQIIEYLKCENRIRAAIRRRLVVALADIRKSASGSDMQPRALEILSVLLSHPNGDVLVDALSHVERDGVKVTLDALKEAIDAIPEFLESVNEPDAVWRYPFAIRSAAFLLHLADEPFFCDYLVELARVRGQGSDPTFTAGLILIALGIVFPFGAVPAVVATTAGLILGTAGLAVDVWGVYETYRKERAYDLAYGAAEFLPETERFATEPADYRGTAIGAVLALFTALDVVRGLGEGIAGLRRARAPEAPAQPPPLPEGTPPSGPSSPGELAFEMPLETSNRLTQEANPEWYRRRRARTPPPEKTRTETPLETQGRLTRESHPEWFRRPREENPAGLRQSDRSTAESATNRRGTQGARATRPKAGAIITSRTVASRDLTAEDIQGLMGRFLRNLARKAAETVKGWKTVAIGLIEDREGFQHLVYTVNNNYSSPAIRDAAAKLHLERWEATPRAGIRGIHGAPGDAEQLLLEAVLTGGKEYRLLAIVPSRSFCGDCIAAILAESPRTIVIGPKK